MTSSFFHYHFDIEIFGWKRYQLNFQSQFETLKLSLSYGEPVLL